MIFANAITQTPGTMDNMRNPSEANEKYPWTEAVDLAVRSVGGNVNGL